MTNFKHTDAGAGIFTTDLHCCHAIQVHHIYTEDQLQQIEKHEAQQAEEKGIDLAAVDASRSGAHCVTGPSSHAHHHHFHSKDNKDRSFHFVNLKRLTKH
eukprot:GHUV01030823.1.p1 GENE.GHUV01030823.1~~GHUV01030823.1.p1  ORF type:complete len:100 (-),score=26.68 GHUV01030823.1:208-507(-)